VTEDLCEVVITAPDADWLVTFTRRLVEDHLAASAQTASPGRSVYEWRGELVERTEARATVRTRTSLVPRIVARLDDAHPYEVPGVIAVPITASSPAYTDWLLAQTEAPSPTD
jgi:periplasmic divalent cation tolerance protein